MVKYFLYARKSTDEPDRQILSIEAQITELKEFAEREQLEIVETFVEPQTAKEPSRPIFNNMLSLIEKGKASGILAWHPDRLSRNSIDGGKIIYLCDLGLIKELKFPTFWFDATPQGKFMLNIAFGQSKYYVDNLSENVKRGLRQKVRRGEYPGVAPTGYLNDKVNHKMVKDPERYRLVQKLFELYATKNYSLKDLRNEITEIGLVSRNGLRLTVSNIQMILRNPFYYGAFKFNGELYEGNRWLELCRNFILMANQAQIAVLRGNFSEKKNFLKRIGSNPFLRERLVFVEYKNPWKLLENSFAEARGPAQQQAVCGVNSAPSEAGNQNFTIWLRGLDSNQNMLLQRKLSYH